MRVVQRFKHAADDLRRALSRSAKATGFVLRARAHLTGVIYHRLGHDIDPERNGEAWLQRELASEWRTFVDVGANVGEWSARAFRYAPGGCVGLLIEPGRAAAGRLRERFSDTDRAQIVEVAASDRSGQATFFEEADAGTTSSLVVGAAHLEACQREVSVRPLDVLLAERGLESVDYLKIDAEGHDLHVLRGAGQWLSEHRVKFLQFEYNQPWLWAGSTLREAIALLDHYGYAVYLLKGHGLHRFPYDVYGDFFHYANFVAFPKERERELARLIRGTI